MMRLTNVCSLGAVFLACLTLFGTSGSASIPDKECFWFTTNLASHPCSCFTGTNHTPTDKCEAGDPSGYWENSAQGIYDLGCTDIVQATCYTTSHNDAYGCGRVVNCNQACDWSDDTDGFGGSIPDPGWSCGETDKGSCTQRYGDCLYYGA